jgi:N utilization substance protein B
MALGLLYSAEAHNADPRELLAAQRVPPGDYTGLLVEGVAEHLEEIDTLIDRYAEGWKADRMPAVDRALARLAVFELGHVPSVPTAAVLSEAVELVGDYSTDRSSRFVNGLLSRIAEELRPDAVCDPDPVA